MNEYILKQISTWKYENQYSVYDLQNNEYIKDSSTWGIEQFAIVEDSNITAYASCQIIGEDMWVGWSLRPDLCGKGMGKCFVKKSMEELINIKKYSGKYIFLKVVNWNTRAIKVYEKIGFVQDDRMVRLENNTYVEYIIMKKYLDKKTI